MRREQRDPEDCQGMHQLIGHSGLKDGQVICAQAVFQPMGGECAQADTGKAEKGGEHEEGAKHGTTPGIGSV